jgi:hypothetical protein
VVIAILLRAQRPERAERKGLLVRKIIGLFAVAALSIGFIAVADRASAYVETATVVPSPSVGSGAYLESVSCISTTSCVAVGASSNGSTLDTLTMSWDGTTWTVLTSPSLSSTDNLLNSVSCASATSCVAVGSGQNAGTAQSLAMSWDGISWTTAVVPSVGADDNFLDSVSCISATNCTAVGSSFDGTGYSTLITTWNGSAWAVAVSPNEGSDSNYLTSVVCTSADFCTAVGFINDGTAVDQTLAMTWDGAGWAIVPTPNNPGDDNSFRSVSCVSPTFCFAIGSTGSGGIETLAMTWDGAAWTILLSPNPAAENDLESISCTSSTECVAVGVGIDISNVGSPLVLTWNGTMWTELSVTDVGAEDDMLSGVSCATDYSCMAVGYSATNGQDQTLAVSLTGPVPPSPDPVAPSFTG